MPNLDVFTIFSIFACVVFTVLLTVFIINLYGKIKRKIHQNKVNHFGDSAEKKVLNFIKSRFPKATVLDSVYLKTHSGLTEIDILLICDRGIFIIEVKSHNGYIVTEGKYWTQRWRDKVIRFHNPVFQNNVHKEAFETMLRKRQSLASLPLYTVVVFTSNNVSFSKKTAGVIKLSDLYSFIKRKKISKRMTREITRNLEKFIRMNMETNRHRQTLHKKRIYDQNAKKRAYKFNK